MQHVRKNAAPLDVWQGAQRGRAINRSSTAAHPHFTPLLPVALAVKKPGRGSARDGSVIVAKVTAFEGETEPILAVAWRSQRGTTAAISVPVVVVDFARRAGVERFYLRDDRRRLAWTCSLDLFNRGRLQADGERYLPLSWLKPVPWREWAYAERVVRLENPMAEPTAEQLHLLEVAP